MSDTPRTVWGYCLEHDSLSVATLAVGDMCQVRDSYSFNDWVSWSAVKACRMVELRVAGPDDLVIRREDLAEAVFLIQKLQFGPPRMDGSQTYQGRLNSEQRGKLWKLNEALAATEGED